MAAADTRVKHGYIESLTEENVRRRVHEATGRSVDGTATICFCTKKGAEIPADMEVLEDLGGGVFCILGKTAGKIVGPSIVIGGSILPLAAISGAIAISWTEPAR